jgi:hypothetical protein
MKFQFKSLATEYLMPVALTTGGIIASRKFLSFDEIFKKKIATDPAFGTGFIMKNEGLIKVGGAGAIYAMFGKKLPPWARLLLLGIGMEGAIKQVGTWTTKTGTDGTMKRLFQPIGAGESNEELDKLIAEGMKGPYDVPTGVGRIELNGPQSAFDLQMDAQTGVSGMGAKNDYGNF